MKWRRMLSWLLVSASVSMFSCQSHAPKIHSQQAALKSIAGCAELLSILKKGAIEQMKAQVVENLERAIESHGCNWGCWDGSMCYEEDAAGTNGGDKKTSSQGGAKEYSTTNTQEQNVDEADFVKNDSKFIYILAGKEFRIYQAWPPSSAHLVSSLEILDIPRNLFVFDDHALVYSDLVEGQSAGKVSGDYACGEWGCIPSSQTKITVLDLKQKSNPKIEREITTTGSYVDSRRIGSAVHTVVSFPEINFPDVRVWPESLDCSREFSEAEITLAFMVLLTENAKVIEATQIEDWLPSMSDTRYLDNGKAVTDTGLLEDCKNFYEPSSFNGQGFLTLLSLEIQDQMSLHLTSIVGSSGEVYASEDALYVAHSPWTYGWWGESGEEETTSIHKFSLESDPPSSTYEASGSVGGRILNQFSMGEYNGFLRVATTTGYLPDPDATNSVFVLEQQGKSLSVVGQLDHIAPSEDIRSARFIGDRGFVVTFKKTDPLFAIDLSDPKHPTIAGELKIPGFSTYIHMMDENHLMAIGFDASDQGDFAWFTGIELQIFDISVLRNPLQEHKLIIGTRGTSSEATGNHLAFNYFPPKDILALPMAICEGGDGNGNYGTTMSFSGLMVYDVTTESGFSERGRVSFMSSEQDPYGCGSWWQNPSTRVKRSIIMDDFVFSIADTQMKVNHLDDLSTDLVVLDLPSIPVEPVYWE